MNLPDLSNMMGMGQLRYIQSQYEIAGYRNPDTAVGKLLSIRQRLACLLRGTLFLSRLRANPFYHYILARTRYYDEIFLSAAQNSATCIINIGCGSDTRAYRFSSVLKTHAVSVVECDQPQAIRIKQDIVRRHWTTDHVRFLPLDLNDEGWSGFSELLDGQCGGPVLVMMEGVSPYVESRSFEAFLRMLAAKLHPRSTVAYDIKIHGVVEEFGRSERTRIPFRLPGDRGQIAGFHERLGFRLRHMETSADLTLRLAKGPSPLFQEDCLLQLELANRG